jgi:hypothetical protein
MAQTLLAIFDTPDEAVSASMALRRQGITGVELLSAEPIHAWQPESEAKSRIGLFAIGGAVLGAALALWLTIGTSRHVNIVTGGMPVVTGWAFGIIAFEVAMLTAIVSAFVCTIFEARLARGGRLRDYDEAVADHKIVMTVSCKTEEDWSAAEKLLADTGARIKEKE